MTESAKPDHQNLDHLNERRLAPLLAWHFAAIIEGVAAVGILFSLESDPANAWLFGLSKGKIAILGGILTILAVLIFLVIRFWRERGGAEKISILIQGTLKEPWAYWLLTGICLIGAILFSQLYHLASVVSDPYVRGYLVKLQPLMFWVLGLSIHTLFLLPLFRYGLQNLRGGRNRRIIRISLSVLILLLLLWAGLVATGIGIEPDKVGWDPPGVPVIPYQGLIAWFAGTGFWVLESWLGHKRGKILNGALGDVLISIILWGTAFLLWSREPLTPDYFAPESRAPNFEFYPYSDAALHDVTAQELLIGEGFSGISRKPVYAIFLALAHVISGQDYLDVVLFQVAALSSFPVLIYLLTKRLHHRISGLISAGLVILREKNAIALSGDIRVSHAKLLMSDLPAAVAMVFIALILVAWLQDPSRKRLHPLAIGGSLGILFLLRPQFVLILPGIVILVLIVFRKQILQGVGNLGIISLGLFLTLTPWLWRSYQLTGAFTLNDPSQMAFLTQQYHHEPGSEFVIRLPNDSEADYNQRINDYLKDFILKNPGFVAGFISSHFVHNKIEMVRVLPTSFWFVQNPDSDLFPLWRSKWEKLWDDCCSVNSYIETAGFWDQERVSINKNQALPLILNLFLISLGIAVLWVNHSLVGMIPLGLSLFYSISTAVGRYSGWRLILPADWVIFVLYAIGIGHITLWLGRFFSNRIEISCRPAAIRKLKGQNVQSFPKVSAVILGFFLFGLGLVPLLIETLVPQRYSPGSESDLLDSLGLFPAEEIHQFFESGKAVIVEGRALYPRYYRSGEGEPGGGWAAFAERDFERLGFFLVGPEKGGVIMPLEDAPVSFPHASDVVVVGCREDEYIDAAVIAVYHGESGDSVVIFRPSLDNLTCPLPSY